MIPNHDLPALRHALMAWFAKHGRRLPWRSDPDPYAVLVSEFMLQQTTVAAVRPYFERWMRDFPDVGALARADEPAVMAHWQGLGYYSRARNLLRAAKDIADHHGGRVPGELALLRTLPGVGPYTASAVAAFAFDQCVPVLDANILRVVARLANFTKPVTTAAAKQLLEREASRLLPEAGGRDHTSALMDLGATICRAGEPDCLVCPVRGFCRAKNPAAIPAQPPRPGLIHERDLRTLAVRSGKIFLTPSPGPRWRGLWVLPPAQPTSKPPALEIGFAVTRHRIRMEVYRGSPRKGWTGFPVDALPPMPSPHRKAVRTLLDSL